MATTENDYPTSPTNDESDDDGQESLEDNSQTEVKKSNFAQILQQLQSSGALIKKPKQEYRCVTCDEDFNCWQELEQHLLRHVTLPSIVLEKLPSDDEVDLSDNENWSEEEDAPPQPVANTPKKIDISEILKQKGIQIKKSSDTINNSDAALSKLSGLGFTIKKNNTPIKEEKEEKPATNNDLMQKIGKLGGIKLKLKLDGNQSNSFKVVNGLKDFKTSDDEEEEGSANEQIKEDDTDEEQDNGGEADSGDEANTSTSRKNSESDDSTDKRPAQIQRKIIPGNVSNTEQLKIITPKTESVKSISQPNPAPSPPNRRPVMKQTPKRGANLPLTSQMRQSSVSSPTHSKEATISSVNSSRSTSPQATSQSPRNSHQTDNVVIKKEVDNDFGSHGTQSSAVPLFSGQIKEERSSPPPSTPVATTTPMLSQVKTEVSNPSYTSESITPLLPVTKKEDNNSGVTIIEINGDSNDEDDDCCVVSATPASDIKPVIPKTENTTSYAPASSYPSLQSSYSSASDINRTPSTEKQHSFNWNAPDSKPPIDMLEKSADDIFEKLLSSAKKEGNLSDTSEYISLDRLGPQHSCDICNTRFTDITMLEDHIRTTGHSKSIVTPSSTLMPYNPSSSSILSSLLPVKQLAEQVGKLSTIGGSSNAFTHQQNVMINIQAYPGASGMMGPPPPYNPYQTAPNMSNYPQSQSNNMYGTPGQQMPGQYPGNYMGQQNYGQQYQQPMPQGGYPGSMQQNPYSTASPLQAMQQSVYAHNTSRSVSDQALGQQMSQMGPMDPSSINSMNTQNNPYIPASSPGGSMKPPMSTSVTGGIRIQNVQTIAPGQLVGANGQPIAPGQVTTAQSPGQVRVAGPNLTGIRPRMPTTVRGARPTIRPGLQVAGQIRGAKPGAVRMQLKRPGQMIGGPGPKRRPDMLLPGKHDNEDCQVMAMQKQRDGLPMIHSVQGAKDKLNLGSQISVTKKTVNKEANAMANVLASRGISVKQKQKSRSPTPERPVPHIPNLGAGVSIKHTSKSSNFSIPESKVGGGMYSCKICKKMFMNSTSLQVHMSNAHPSSKIPVFKCDECPASYPKSLQLQHHKRVFHNVSGPNRELGLPVVDMSQTENLKKLSNLGIYSFIPLANREQPNGCFGIPIISVQTAQNGVTNSLHALGADGLLSLGPLKPIHNT